MIRILTVLLLVVMLAALAGCKGAAQESAPGAPSPPPGDPSPPSSAQGIPPGDPGTPPAAPVILPDGREVNESMVNELDVATSEEPETKVPDTVIPIPADYEEEVAKKITVANMESELDALEVELSIE